MIARKNRAFANTPRGLNASAANYGIGKTAKEINLNPAEYLVFLVETLPNNNADDSSALDALMPWSRTLPKSCR